MPERGIQDVISFPSEGRPPSNVVFPMGDPERCFEHPICAIDWFYVPSNQMLLRGCVRDSWTAALKGCGATKAARHGFRMLDAPRELRVPLFPKDYEVWTPHRAPRSN